MPHFPVDASDLWLTVIGQQGRLMETTKVKNKSEDGIFIDVFGISGPSRISFKTQTPLRPILYPRVFTVVCRIECIVCMMYASRRVDTTYNALDTVSPICASRQVKMFVINIWDMNEIVRNLLSSLLISKYNKSSCILRSMNIVSKQVHRYWNLRFMIIKFHTIFDRNLCEIKYFENMFVPWNMTSNFQN